MYDIGAALRRVTAVHGYGRDVEEVAGANRLAALDITITRKDAALQLSTRHLALK
jgi:hypothetical protein